MLTTPIVNKIFVEQIERCASVLAISGDDIDTESQPFSRGGFGEVYKATWQRASVVVKVGTNRLNCPHKTEIKQFQNCFETVRFQPKQNAPDTKRFRVSCAWQCDNYNRK